MQLQNICIVFLDLLYNTVGKLILKITKLAVFFPSLHFDKICYNICNEISAHPSEQKNEIAKELKVKYMCMYRGENCSCEFLLGPVTKSDTVTGTRPLFHLYGIPYLQT